MSIEPNAPQWDNRIKKIHRLNYAFNFKSDHFVYLQSALRDKWLLLKCCSHQHMAAFIFSYTAWKIEFSHCLEPILFSHASQTPRNKRQYHWVSNILQRADQSSSSQSLRRTNDWKEFLLTPGSPTCPKNTDSRPHSPFAPPSEQNPPDDS